MYAYFCKIRFANGVLIFGEAIEYDMAELISHEGVVVRADEFVRLQRVLVRIEQKAACAGCKAKSMCTASETMVKEVEAVSFEPLKLGDRVEVTVEKRLGWKAVLLAFVIPFMLLLLLVWLLPRWIGSEVIVGTLAILSLLPYYLILHLFEGRFEQQYNFVATPLAGPAT